MKVKKNINPLSNFPEVQKSEINFFSEEIKFVLKKKRLLRSWIEMALKKETQNTHCLNYIFCSDSFLSELNVKYLNHDTLTDIITFDYSDDLNLSGDIYISIDRVKENSSKYKTSFAEELNRVMIHGVLHLCGYKDKTKTAKKLMTAKEDYYLSLL